MANTPPTKGNLMAAKRSRALAATGWELMDKKRNILTRELMDRMDRAAALQSEIDDIFNAAYGALEVAEIATGSVTGVYKYGCELFKKRMECAIMVEIDRQLGEDDV